MPAAGETVKLTLHWQALQNVPHSYTIFVHLIDPNGNVVAQSDVLPGQGKWPTNSWYPNEWLTDHIPLTLPADLPAGTYQIALGWYHVESGRRLPLIPTDSAQTSLMLGALTVK